MMRILITSMVRDSILPAPMPTRFSVSGRVFAPSWLMTLLTVILLTAFVSLGRWQWHRGEARQALWEQYARSDDSALIANRADFERIDRFRNARLQGSFAPARQFLLDNLSHAGQAGYQVLTPFRLIDGRLVLVNRGWIPAGG